VTQRTFALALALTLAGIAGACDDPRAAARAPDGTADARPATPSPASASIALAGAGATFPYPIYSRWISRYVERTGVRINYQSVGSDAGLRQFADGTVDFAATERPAADSAGAERRGPVLHIPMVVGAVAVTYNLPGVTAPLRLTGALLADLFSGRITQWNDPRIAAANPGARLPTDDVVVVYRDDGSGTTALFTHYLARTSREWARGPGEGRQVRWPTGVGGSGNEGVAGHVKQTVGAVGYVELAYARQNRLPTAALRNRAGEFVVPTVETIAAAAELADSAAAGGAGDEERVSLVDAPARDAYPVASLTWIVLRQQSGDSARAKALVDFLNWALTDGQREAAALDYAPLPPGIAARARARLRTVATAGATRPPPPS
jgi:phosphate transport system substrate-binding protein